jgi:hypothetical protein
MKGVDASVEKIKDLIHDYSDILLALLIAAAMVMVVFLNLTSIFDENQAAAAQPISSIANEPEHIDVPIVIEPENTPDETEIAPEELRHEPVTETEGAQPPVAEQPAAGTHVSVTIPNGTPGSGIARILVEHQLLSEPAPFIEAAESLSLSLSLKSGTFQIPVGTSAEEMVKIIAGQ